MPLRTDREYMQLALALAAKARGKTYPNPMVGALIVSNGRIVGEGYHRRCGGDHAEVMAIKDASGACTNATMFVTLEPCDHYGRTPPCTQAIIESGIRAVNIAMKDPNPANNGRGIRKLREAGISVNTGLCSDEAERLNHRYVKFITTQRPFVTIKLAQSIDGKIAARDGSSKWISSDASRKFVKELRGDFDAICVGINTVLKDDPFLLGENRQGNGAARVIVDSRLRTPIGSNIIKTAGRSPVIIGITEHAPVSRVRNFKKIDGVHLIAMRSRKARVPLNTFLKKLAGHGVFSILVEGGGELAGSLVDEDLVDEAVFFISPKIIGGAHSSIKGEGVRHITKAVQLRDAKTWEIGGDIVVKGQICSRG